MPSRKQPSFGDLPIDLAKLLETRMFVQANSGGGKSWLLRRLLEQTNSMVQQIVIDPDGEYSSLRKNFDYIICAPQGADAVANPSTAEALARAIWESGTSAILDIFELKAHERSVFVKRFLESLISAPKKIWHPTLVIIDEIHLFAPQSGHADSTEAVIDLATRGRKRGLSLVGATQRIPKFHKDCAAELLNKLIGRTSLDVDVQRAADEVGFTKQEAFKLLRNLEPGEFYAYGPALCRDVTKTRIGPVSTSHPTSGNRGFIAPPPPSAAIKAKLAKIEGIQREAEAETKTNVELRKEVADLTRRLKFTETLRLVAPDISQAALDKTRAEGYGKAQQEFMSTVQQKALCIFEKALSLKPGTLSWVPNLSPSVKGPFVKPIAAAKVSTTSLKAQGVGMPSTEEHMLDGPQQRILDAIAWFICVEVEQPLQQAVAFMAGYRYGGGGFNNPRGRLKQAGLIQYCPGNRISLTEQGRQLATPPDSIGTKADLHARVMDRLEGPERRILAPLLEVYPDSMSQKELAEKANYAPGSGGFNNPRGRLKTLGLVEYPEAGQIRAADCLFLKSA